MVAARRSYSSDSSDVENEALILHQLEVDSKGRPIISSTPAATSASSSSAVPSASSTAQGRQQYGDDDDDLDATSVLPTSHKTSRFKTEPESEKLDKTGRPEWLSDVITNPSRRSRKLRIALIAGLLLIAAGSFWFAFGSGKHYYTLWTGKYTASDADKFPQDVGYPGPTKTGSPADLADESRQTFPPKQADSPIQTHIPSLPADFNAFKHMGPLSPYSSSDGFGIDDAKYRDVPDGLAHGGSCTVDQVHILHRHGARYPTSNAPPQALAKFLSSQTSATFKGPLSFLSTWKNRLGAELLTPVGRGQLYDSGVFAAIRYGSLVADDLSRKPKIVVRAGSQFRIIDSAVAWLSGFFGPTWRDSVNLEIQIEANHFNSTISPWFACPNGGKAAQKGYKESNDWIESAFRSTAERLSQHVEGFKFNATLAYAAMQTCSYETVAFGRSDFCGLFTKDEWLAYEYAWDLNFHGSYGPGSPTGRAQGVGYWNEFFPRLLRQPWNPATQTTENATLASDPVTFPVDQRAYFDFAHDTTITGVLAALGLPDFAKPLDPKRIEPQRAYQSTRIVPFAARMTVEVLNCTRALEPTTLATASASPARYIRLVLNDAVIPLGQLSPCERRVDGLCSFDNFVASQAKRTEEAQFSNCTDPNWRP
ncbi:hypothetical protein OC846_000154 [Tilletia horrida]|uniref:3-phytase n=1 Tax=Tilletia horrida TaxID=155126 RepID=A0AAN6GW50_9BASI|nr:hypothetical protein OC846_000154 [Tilletia horrida]KAK0570096.1 hypothetical protein OC861_000238 [Tilletia horrida]